MQRLGGSIAASPRPLHFPDSTSLVAKLRNGRWRQLSGGLWRSERPTDRVDRMKSALHLRVFSVVSHYLIRARCTCVRKAAGLVIEVFQPTIRRSLIEDNACGSVLSSGVCILAISAGRSSFIRGEQEQFACECQDNNERAYYPDRCRTATFYLGNNSCCVTVSARSQSQFPMQLPNFRPDNAMRTSLR
jgi:hypothetical protein